MKENLSNVTDPERKAFCTDAEIIRYLKARDFDVSKSEQLLRDTLEWRFNTYKPHLIDPKCVSRLFVMQIFLRVRCIDIRILCMLSAFSCAQLTQRQRHRRGDQDR